MAKRINLSPEQKQANYRFGGRYLVIHPWKQGTGVQFAIQTKIGNAVTRNTVRRRLRAALRTLELRPGGFTCAVTRYAPEATYQELKAELEALLRKAKLLV